MARLISSTNDYNLQQGKCLTGTAATYDMSAQALSENISGGLFTGTSSDWNGKNSWMQS